MGGPKRVVLFGFEEAVAAWVRDNFKFSTVPLEHTVLKFGRNLFAQDLPSVEDVRKTEAVNDFDINREPMVGIFTDPGLGVTPSVGNGARMEWNIRLQLRFGVVPEIAKRFLEELVSEIVKRIHGAKSNRFIIKGVNILNRPTLDVRKNDEHAMMVSTLKFFVVARN